MKLLSKSYPNLTILAGSTLTRKEKSADYLHKMTGYYKNLKEVESFEKRQSNSSAHLAPNRKRVEQLIKDLKKTPDEIVTVYANKARIYHQGKEYKHGKVVPFNEVKFDSKTDVYQPGKNNNKPGKNNNRNPHIIINENLSLGVSICREFFVDQTTVKKTPIPLFHCLIAKGMPTYIHSIHAKHGLISVDIPSCGGTQYILARGHEKTNIQVEVYLAYATIPFKQLKERIKPIYPVQFKLLDAIERELKETKDNKKYYELLIEMQNKLLKLHEETTTKRYHKIDHFSLLAIKKYSPQFYSELNDILDLSVIEPKDNKEVLSELFKAKEYNEFINLSYELKHSELVLVAKNILRLCDYNSLKKLLNKNRPNATFNDIVYHELSFGEAEAKPIVKRLFEESCDLSEGSYIFYRYFNQTLFNSFIKIARLYFSLEDYCPSFFCPGFFGNVKNNTKYKVLSDILIKVHLDDAGNLDELYYSLKKDLYSIYKDPKVEEQDKESQYYKTVLTYNFGKK
jgi:hypothetical protein